MFKNYDNIHKVKRNKIPKWLCLRTKCKGNGWLHSYEFCGTCALLESNMGTSPLVHSMPGISNMGTSPLVHSMPGISNMSTSPLFHARYI